MNKLCTLKQKWAFYIECAHLTKYVPCVHTLHTVHTVHTMCTRCAHCGHQMFRVAYHERSRVLVFPLHPSNACSLHKRIDKRNTLTRIFGPRESLGRCASGVHSVHSVHSVHRCAHGVHVSVRWWWGVFISMYKRYLSSISIIKYRWRYTNGHK